MDNVFISHIKQAADGQWVIQPNEEHQLNVALLAKSFAESFGLPEWGYTLGILHDEGKKRKSFQNYIRKASGYDTTVRVSNEHNHAFVGGIVAKEIYGNAFLSLLSNQIASHHRGLYDYDELFALLENGLPNDYEKCTHDLNLKVLTKELNDVAQSKSLGKSDFHHLARVLFSCLVDADYLDTEQFMNNNSAKLRGSRCSMSELLPMLENYIQSLGTNCSEVNVLRRQVQQRCRDVAYCECGIYSMTVPTGGGKTLASVLWAMKHANHNGQQRIIIAIPYTSIIVQTASILKKIFGEENVLEHHSNFNPDTITDEYQKNRAKLATENWDYPIIVTTNVQLFESIYNNKPSACRKLHNIANSVLVLDEVQTLPTQFLRPIVDSLKTYHKLFSTSVLLTTASQPMLSGEITGCNPLIKFNAFDKITEIVPAEYRLAERLKRVEITVNDISLTYDDIAAEMSQHPKVLCIVNTRKDAKEIFDRLPSDGLCFHLSRMMCPEHIRTTIEEIKEALRQNVSTIRVVSTQLVEAGVDIDFPVVFRQESGLDSVLQAAGRCNREGAISMGQVMVFKIRDRFPRGFINSANEARKSLPKNCDPLAPDTMTKYFKQLYARCDNFDKSGIEKTLYKMKELCFETASKGFKLIEESGTPIIVNYGKAVNLIERLKQDGVNYATIKRLAAYSVTVHDKDFKSLISTGCVQEVTPGVFFIEKASAYDDKVGLLSEDEIFDEIMII